MLFAASWPLRPPVESRHLTPHTSRSGTWKPRTAPGSGRDSGSQGPPMAVAGLGCRKKRMPRCNGADTGLKVPRRESEPTSGRSFIAREFVRTVSMRQSK